MKTTKSAKKGMIQDVAEAINRNSDACLDSMFKTYYGVMFSTAYSYIIMGYTGALRVVNTYTDFCISVINDLQTGGEYGDLSEYDRKSLLELLEKRKNEILIQKDFLKRADDLANKPSPGKKNGGIRC